MIATAALLLLPLLHQPAGTPTPPAPPAPAAASPAPTWAWTAGREDRYTITLNQSAQEQSAGAVLLAVSDEQTLGFTLRTLSVAADGAAVVECKLDALRVAVTPAQNAAPIVVDSAAEPGHAEFDPNAPARALVGLAFKLTLANDGSVRAVEGLPELRERVRKVFSDNASITALAEPVLAALQEKSLASAFGAAFSFSDAPGAAPPVSLPGVGPLESKASLQRDSSGPESIVKRTVVYTLPKGNPDAAARSYDIAVAEGTFESAARVTPSQGRLVSYTSTLSLKLSYTPKPGVDAPPRVRAVAQTTRIEPRAPDASTPPAPTPGAPGKP